MGNRLLVFIHHVIQKTFALAERTLDCLTAILVSPHKIHPQKQVLGSMEGRRVVFSGERHHKVMPRVVAGLRGHLPLMAGKGQVECDVFLGAEISIDAKSRTLASLASYAGHSCEPADVLSRRLFHIATKKTCGGRQRSGRDH